MLDRVLEENRLRELIDDLSKSRRIIGPVKRDDHYFYEPVTRASDLDLGFNYCVYSPKHHFFPSHETLFTFNQKNAIRLLDRVFSRNYPDEHYAARRRNTFILGIDCPRPCTEGVFCRDMKSNAATDGFDLMCYPIGGAADKGGVRYGVVFGTKAGRELILYAQAGARPTVEDERA